jgi:hypothetical protein
MTDLGVLLILLSIASYAATHNIVVTKDGTGKTTYSIEENKEK